MKKHKGALGSEYSFGSVSDDSVIIRCLKKKHHSAKAEYVVRFNEDGNSCVKEYKQQLTAEIKSELKNETQIAVSVIEQYHKLQEDGTMTEEEAKKAAADKVREMRYDDGNGYFWIDTSKGVNVVLLGRDTEGKSRWDAEDKTGRKYIQEMIKNGQKDGGGYTNLNFPKPNETEEKPKINYTVTYEPYDWVLGTGVWVDDIDTLAQRFYADTRNQINTAIISMCIAAIVLAIGLIFIFSFPVKKITEALNAVTGNLRKVAKGDLSEIAAHGEQAAAIHCISGFVEPHISPDLHQVTAVKTLCPGIPVENPDRGISAGKAIPFVTGLSFLRETNPGAVHFF